MSLRTGLHRGVVTRAGSSGVFVQLPDLYGDSEIGPLDYVGPRLRRPQRSTETADSHTHTIAEVFTTVDRFTGGDRVLVASIGPGDWVVIGRLETGANQ
jgi:hypothetical protein